MGFPEEYEEPASRTAGERIVGKRAVAECVKRKIQGARPSACEVGNEVVLKTETGSRAHVGAKVNQDLKMAKGRIVHDAGNGVYWKCEIHSTVREDPDEAASQLKVAEFDPRNRDIGAVGFGRPFT